MRQARPVRLGAYDGGNDLSGVGAVERAAPGEHLEAATQPHADAMSARSTTRPRACSGLMYDAVPRITPTRVIAGLVIVGELSVLAEAGLRVRIVGVVSGFSRTIERFRQTEVEHLDDAVGAQLDVRRLEIAME